MHHSTDESDEEDSDADRKSKSKRKHNNKKVRWDSSPFSHSRKRPFRKASSIKSKGSFSSDGESSEANDGNDSDSSSEDKPRRRSINVKGIDPTICFSKKGP